MPFAERSLAADGNASPALARNVPTLLGVAFAALLLGAASSTLAATEPAPSGPLASGRILNGVVAVVDGDPITLHELKRYGVTDAPFLPPDVRGDFRALLDAMIEHRLLKTEFEKNGITVPDAMVDRYIAGVLEERKQTRPTLEADIAKAGLSWKDYYERMREEVQRIQLVNLLIRSRVNIPEEEVRQVWESDPQFAETEKLEVGTIFLPLPSDTTEADKVREQAVQVQKDARRDFEATARKYSKGPGAAEGGHLGEFKRGSMAAYFEKALEGLHAGDVSVPVDGSGGLYIVKLFKVHAAGRRPFDEVKQELTEKLYDKRLSERYQKWANEDLRKDHRVENMVESLALIAAGPVPGVVAAPAAASAPAPATASSPIAAPDPASKK